MTLSAAWLRSDGNVRELVMATDSRLRGPFVWDACPKILSLARNDCALAFAGSTSVAYPFMLQVHAAVKQYAPSLNRAVDLVDFKGHVLNVINGMRSAMHSFPTPPQKNEEEETYLVLGGYSWRFAQFKIWTLHYDKLISEFTFRPATAWDGIDGDRLLAVVGDHVPEAKKRLLNLLDSKGKKQAGGFDMEPFEVLRDMIRLATYTEIGGPPQLVKVYRHMNCTPFAVHWPNSKSGQVTVLGRALLSYEKSEVGILNPDTLEIGL